MKHSKGYCASIAASAVIALLALADYTHGFTSYTYEGVRRARIDQQPVDVGNWALQDASGQTTRLTDFADDWLLVDFIYTRCPTICRALGSRYQQLERLIADRQLDNVKLVSISIDPQYDTPKKLAHYQKSYGLNTGHWTVTRPHDLATLEQLQEQTGLRVIDDPIWGFAHSDGIHLLRNRQLVAIMDPFSKGLESLLDRVDRD